MKYIAMLLIFTLCLGAKLAKAPEVENAPVRGDIEQSMIKPTPPKNNLDQNIIASIPDLRSIAGSPGKNIVFAEDGHNVAVIYGLFSGDPDNIMQVYVSYSTDRGLSWLQYGPLSTFNARRIYPGLDAEQDWPDPNNLMVHFAWHQASRVSGAYVASPTFYAKEISYPDGLITAAFELPNSEDWDVWLPCIGVKDSFVVYTATNNGTYITTYDCYIWRSTDYGETWDDGRIFFPGPLEWMAGPHFRFGSDGYMFFLWNRQEVNNPTLYWPYYCESFDYGETWTDPQVLWQNTPPYPDMSSVRSWWYKYDCEVVGDTPVVIIELSRENYDYGEIWAYRPDSGGPGHWHFKGVKLVGGDSTAPQLYARSPSVAADDRGTIYACYQAIFETPTDTGPDIGLFFRPAGQDTWIDWGMVTNNAAAIEEKNCEFAHNAAIVGIQPQDSAIVAMIFHNAGDYPTSGNLYFHYVAIPYDSIRQYQAIGEAKHCHRKQFTVLVAPNPFRNLVRFILPAQISEVKIAIFDVTGKLVRELETTVWDGKRADGSRVDPGVYFYTVDWGNNTYQGKIILTR
uniref:T9SS type A sorting domain-containing protein n=1 Tax=candidate division WOR-3 bacterium TaxID=2052148 RepID=A0A7C6EF37_UNCW3